MKMTLNKADLLSVLSRGSLPLKVDPSINSAFRGFGKMKVSGSRFSIQALGQRMATNVFINVDDDKSEDGTAIFSIEHMASLVKYFPKAEKVVVEKRVTEDDPVGKVVVVSGKSRLVLPCIHGDVYDDIEIPKTVLAMECDRDCLVGAIASVISYGMPIDADGVRSNICFRGDGKTTYAGATDGIACCYNVVPETFLDGALHLPINVAKVLPKFLLDGGVKFYASDNHMYIVQERGFMRVSVPAGVMRFPDYTKLMDMPQEGPVTVSTENLLQLVSACKQVNPEEAMMLVSDESVELRSLAPVGETGYDGSVACAEGSASMDVVVGFSPFMTIEYLKHLDDESVDIEFSSNKNIHGWPCHIKMSRGNYTLFIKSRMAMTSSLAGE